MSLLAERRGDQPGYFLSAAFWADRYRDQISGEFTTRETIRARQAKAALEREQGFSESVPLGEVEALS